MKKNTIVRLWTPILLLSVVLVTSVIVYIHVLNQNFEEEVLRTLEEVSAQGAESVRAEIEAKESLLEELAAVMDIDIEAEPEELQRSVQSGLRAAVSDSGFQEMGIILTDGTVYSTEGARTRLEDEELIQSVLSGDANVSGRIPIDMEADGYVTVYSVPILEEADGQMKAVIYAISGSEQFRETVEVTSFHGEGYSYLIEENGDVVVDSAHSTAFQNMTNIYQSLEDADASNGQAIQELQAYIAQGESGKTTFRNRVDKYLYCRPVGVNDWYLLTVVPVSVMDNQMNMVVRSTIVLVVLLAVVFGILVWLLVSQQRRKQKELLTLVYVDPVTGGDTFSKFQRDYAAVMAACPEQRFALLSLDLNRFKMINDLYGSEEGDRILRNMDRIWRELLREHEFCGHRMGDRFVVLLTYETKEELEQRVREYRRRLRETAHNRYKLSLRVGIYQIKENTEEFSTAHSRSMMAFSAAKDSEQHFYAFYDDAMEEQLVWEKHVEDSFQKALRNHEFVVFYQAKVQTETGKISGAEALARWVRPDGTIVPPGKFIPVLESNDTIAELDRYMFREVCLQQKAWLDAGKPIVPVSVNLSRVQLADRNLVATYKEILEETGLPPQYVGLEFTESAMFDNEAVLRETVDSIHALGMKVLIDDFGVGYSSMMSLKVIPVDILKVDKSFIDSIGDERGDKIVISIIEFATSLGMSVTAEGVENAQQYQFLQTHRCDDIQGYYFSKPAPAGEYAHRYLEAGAV